jgi:hypothetical protein
MVSEAKRKNKAITLTDTDLSVYEGGGIRVLSLFAGIECALVAVKQVRGSEESTNKSLAKIQPFGEHKDG